MPSLTDRVLTMCKQLEIAHYESLSIVVACNACCNAVGIPFRDLTTTTAQLELKIHNAPANVPRVITPAKRKADDLLAPRQSLAVKQTDCIIMRLPADLLLKTLSTLIWSAATNAHVIICAAAVFSTCTSARRIAKTEHLHQHFRYRACAHAAAREAATCSRERIFNVIGLSTLVIVLQTNEGTCVLQPSPPTVLHPRETFLWQQDLGRNTDSSSVAQLIQTLDSRLRVATKARFPPTTCADKIVPFESHRDGRPQPSSRVTCTQHRPWIALNYLGRKATTGRRIVSTEDLRACLSRWRAARTRTIRLGFSVIRDVRVETDQQGITYLPEFESPIV